MWALEVLARRGLIVGKRVAIDATTLEANAAMRSIVRRDTGASYDEFLTELAKASGIETPTREDLARLDRKRKKRTSNKEWKSPFDEDARVAIMKDGRTHLAHKAEHAVDLDSGAMVAVTLQAADKGDTTTLDETLIEAGCAVAELVVAQADSHSEVSKVNIYGIEELVADKGYLSGAVLKRVKSYGVRSYIPEKRQKGKRRWQGKAEEQQATYENRRRVRGHYGKSLLKRRGELVERSFAHCYETGGMRRCHSRGRENILKRELVHMSAFNLILIMRQLLGVGTPRELKNRAGQLFCVFSYGSRAGIGSTGHLRPELPHTPRKTAQIVSKDLNTGYFGIQLLAPQAASRKKNAARVGHPKFHIPRVGNIDEKLIPVSCSQLGWRGRKWQVPPASTGIQMEGSAGCSLEPRKRTPSGASTL